MPRMAVNISTLEFRNEKFIENVFAILHDAGLAAESLELELIEGALMKHLESTHAILNALRAAGVQIAVDDFGTGYSSLGYCGSCPSTRSRLIGHLLNPKNVSSQWCSNRHRRFRNGLLQLELPAKISH
jgi:EAL domain-containing protein (putative c-di-GMP-specific phosphodiesterase class I)